MSTHTRLSQVGVLCLMLVSALFIGCGQTAGSPWESYIQAGEAAYEQGNYAEAEKQFLAALQEAENFGPEDPRLATSLNNLAVVFRAQGKYEEAEPLYQRSLAIDEKALGPEHPKVATTLENYADLLRKTGRENEASSMEARAQAIREKNAQENPHK
ncbi:MAG: tetratricopeptide repeat protein [Acidobacteria bacterium]|nr:tetratricopeptide repeat protein [Acidobacteriota bacterium]